MPDPTQFDPDPIRVALDHGEVVELDGGTLLLGGEESPSVVLRLAPWRARCCTGHLPQMRTAAEVKLLIPGRRRMRGGHHRATRRSWWSGTASSGDLGPTRRRRPRRVRPTTLLVTLTPPSATALSRKSSGRRRGRAARRKPCD
jgi:hypothetical protein